MGTREAILDAALDLIQTVGANAMSYQDLAERVGVSKPSIHHHFATKAVLIEAVIDWHAKHFLGEARSIVASERTGREQLAAYAGLFEKTLRSAGRGKACPCGMLGAEVATLSEAAAARLGSFIESNEHLIAQMLERGEKDGTLPTHRDRAAAAAHLFAALEGALFLARVSGGVRQFRRVVEQVIGAV